MADDFTEAQKELWETPLAAQIEYRQKADQDVYIHGFSEDGRRALVISVDGQYCSIASIHDVNTLGRWECSKQHYQDHMDLYNRRFPLR